MSRYENISFGCLELLLHKTIVSFTPSLELVGLYIGFTANFRLARVDTHVLTLDDAKRHNNVTNSHVVIELVAVFLSLLIYTL